MGHDMSSEGSCNPLKKIPLGVRAMDAIAGTSHLDGLNTAQREAVQTIEGPVLMLAGAGTGKTSALTSRIAHIINEGAAKPGNILAVTFTNKAAREMKDRVARHGSADGAAMPWLGTFHNICNKLLRRHAELVDLKTNLTILDRDDQLRVMDQLAAASEIDRKKWPVRQLGAIIDSWKNRAWTHENVPQSQKLAYNSKGIELYRQYEDRLVELNAVDFGNLILHMISIFRKHDDILEKYRRRFQYILVDEYQDTNVAQYLWLRLLADGHKNICCVGDDDQSIYGWRGAEVENILRFEKDYPNAKVVRLEQNYRSGPHILSTASCLIAKNKRRLGKELWTDLGEGEKVRLACHFNSDEEARWIGEEIESLQHGTRGQRRYSPGEIAILVRNTSQMRAFEERFITTGIPYIVVGGPRFYERMEIRDAIAYFRIAISPLDDLAFDRIVNKPKRGLGNVAQRKIHDAASGNGVCLVDAAEILMEQNGIRGAGARELRLLLDQLAIWNRLARDPKTSHTDLAMKMLDESGYSAMWQKTRTPDAPGRLENLKELINVLGEFENLQGFMEHVGLIMDNDSVDDVEKVTLITLHSAKGLEYPVVFLPGWEEGLFPSKLAMDEKGELGEEEERRLAYVGITRAMELCTLSFAQNRWMYGSSSDTIPSRFIDELPDEHIEIATDSGYGGNGSGRPEPFPDSLEERAARADVYKSPGWRRLQQNRNVRKPQLPVMEAEICDYSIGERVFHMKFGYGRIVEIDGDKVVVDFDKAGLKRVVANYVFPPDAAPL